MNRQIIECLKLPETVRIPLLGGIWYRLLNNADNKNILKQKITAYPLNKEIRDIKVTVSLTSFPARIQYVHLAIKSLMMQTYKPDRIVLWLAEEQFPTKELPNELLSLQENGLEIIWMHDLYGHKKYFYPIINQADDEVVITFDDDIIYSPNCINRLIKTHTKHPDCVVCDRGQTITFNKKGSILPNPGSWKVISTTGVHKPTYSMNPSPGGGCLIPKGAFFKDSVDEEKIRGLAYKNDDLWYMFMCAENKTRMIKTRKYHKAFSVIDGSQTVQMATENVVENKNVVIMEGLKTAYPEAWRRISTDED